MGEGYTKTKCTGVVVDPYLHTSSHYHLPIKQHASGHLAIHLRNSSRDVQSLIAVWFRFRFRFRYVLHPWAAKYSHWMCGKLLVAGAQL
jgi:hypothetical protein